MSPTDKRSRRSQGANRTDRRGTDDSPVGADASGRLARIRRHRKRHVRKYLLGNAPLPEDQLAAFHVGGDDEAVTVASEMIDDWEAIEGARDWLDENTKSRPQERPRRKK